MQATVGIAVPLRCPCATETRDQRLWPFAATSPWNVPLGSGATFAAENDPRTVDLHAGHTAINAKNYSHPVYLAAATDPMHMLTLVGSGRTVFYRIPAGATPAGGTDAHMHVIDADGSIVHETWRATQTGPFTWTAESYKEIDLRGSGIAPRSSQNIGTRAYGGSAIAGLIRAWELEAGAIRHALAVSLMKSQLQAGPVWPATAEDPPSQYSGHIPMGTLMAIKPDVDLGALGLTTGGLMVARALQDYGAYAVDTGSNGPAFYAEPDADPGIVRQISGDLPRLLGLLYPVTNNGEDNVGGGGTPRTPLAPPFAD